MIPVPHQAPINKWPFRVPPKDAFDPLPFPILPPLVPPQPIYHKGTM